MAEETEVSEENLPLCPPQTTHDLPWAVAVERIMLKWILKKFGGTVSTPFDCFSIGLVRALVIMVQA
jgi:hypothetical protein